MIAVDPATAAIFMAALNAADSRQRSARESAGGIHFRSPAFQSCLKVADSTGTQSNAPVVLGNCATPRAQWRQVTVNGTPRVLVNRGNAPRDGSAAVHRGPVRHAPTSGTSTSSCKRAGSRRSPAAPTPP